MGTANYSYSASIAGKSVSKAVVRQADHESSWGPITLPVAHSLSSWVKTDADTAAGNLAGGHGLSTGAYDVYWDGGARYDVECTISTNAVALDGGAGDDFPASANATVRMAPQVAINTPIDGDEVEIAFVRIGYASDAEAVGERGRVAFADADDDDIADLEVEGSGASASEDHSLIYDVAGGATNPFTGDPIVAARASQSNVSLAATLLIAVLADATP